MSTVTKKGQVTIPKTIRERLHIKQGDEVVFKLNNEQVVIEKVNIKAQFRKYVGFLKGKTDQETDDIIRQLRDE